MKQQMVTTAHSRSVVCSPISIYSLK